jgi:hypothetical protein
VYVADDATNIVHMITPSGNISTVAGTGVAGYSLDGGLANAAALDNPGGLATGPDGSLYIADVSSNRVRRISGGIITTVAGTGLPGYSGDGGPATNAQLTRPVALATDSSGNLFIADADSVIRKVALDGTISTVAGDGTAGFSGDGVAATATHLNWPGGLAADQYGNLYIADTNNSRIRKVDANGIITTVAGTGVAGFQGDGIPATAVQLYSPGSVAVDTAGNIYIADMIGERVRLVTTDGLIHTIAGGAVVGAGEGAPATEASISPWGMTLDPGGNIYFLDFDFGLHVLTTQGGPALFSISSTHAGNLPQGASDHFTLIVTNAPLAGPTSGTITVTDFIPDGLTLLQMSGDGWQCTDNTCTRSDLWNGATNLPAITVDVMVSPTAPTQVTNQVIVSGGGATTAGSQDLTLISVPTNIQTNPSGLQFSVDALPAQVSPQTVDLVWGPHTIAVVSPQSGGAGIRYVYTGWSDSAAASHTFTVDGTSNTYTANFKTQYQLTTLAYPSSEGSVTPATGNFYDAGSSVTLTAKPSTSNPFTFWSGAAAGLVNPTPITMNAPASVTANFFTCAVTGDTTTTVADVQLMISEALGNAQALHDMNQDGAVNVADIQKVLGSAAGTTCLY